MRKPLEYVIAYVAWFAAAAGGIIILLLARAAVDQTYLLARMPVASSAFVDQASLFIMALICLVLILVTESYFREGVERGVLYQRIVRVFVAEAVLAAVLHVFPLVLAALL
jgi:hypothetical protein